MFDDEGVVIPPNSKGSFEIKVGVKYVFDYGRPYGFFIKTKGGTIIEGRATPNNPLSITPGEDVEDIRIVIDEEQSPLHLC